MRQVHDGGDAVEIVREMNEAFASAPESAGNPMQAVAACRWT